MKENNIFKFATKELSQDAFICWLVNWLNIENADEDIRKISMMFVNKIIKGAIKTREDKRLKQAENTEKLDEEIELLKGFILNNDNKEDIKVEVKRQHKRIDTLLILTNTKTQIFIIIEDKICSEEHDLQIKKYKKEMEIENKDKIVLTCYYKLYEEDAVEEKEVDYIYTLKELNELFSIKKDIIQNVKNRYQYVNDYVKYIEEFNKCIDSFSMDIKLSDLYRSEKIFEDYNIISKDKVIEIWNCEFLKRLKEQLIKNSTGGNTYWSLSSRGNKPTNWLNKNLVNIKITTSENLLLTENPILKLNLDADAQITFRIIKAYLDNDNFPYTDCKSRKLTNKIDIQVTGNKVNYITEEKFMDTTIYSTEELLENIKDIFDLKDEKYKKTRGRGNQAEPAIFKIDIINYSYKQILELMKELDCNLNTNHKEIFIYRENKVLKANI